MKLIDREVVPGTGITIGRRVQHRRLPDGTSEARPSTSYTAVYTDDDGKKRTAGLGRVTLKEARRKAVRLQQSLDDGLPRQKQRAISIRELTERFMAFNETRDLAPRTMARYRTDVDKLSLFCQEIGLTLAKRFDEVTWYRYAAWLKGRSHKQGTTYADKTRYTTLTVCKQVFNFGVRQKLLAADPMPGVHLPKARAKPQVCPTTNQVNLMLGLCDGLTHAAIAIAAYQGLRYGEIEALQWDDVRLDMGELGMLHIRRGAATGHTKTKQERFVPIHPAVRPIIESLPRTQERVLPGLKERTLLAKVKKLGEQAGVPKGLKIHSMRHHFASMCANSRIPYRLAMQWLGHSSSQILDLYYHLHDEESEAAMKVLAARDLLQNTK